MALTLEEAKALRSREVIIDNHGRRWYVNGAVKRWKTDPDRIRVPLKHGLYTYGQLTNDDFDPIARQAFNYTKENQT